MSDNELLLAISGMLDEKIKPLKEQMIRLEDRMGGLEARMGSLETRMSQVETGLISVRERQTKVELLLENEVMPRLQNIEACYTGTYDRYATEITKIEAMEQDIDILKKVVKEHSEKLVQIA